MARYKIWDKQEDIYVLGYDKDSGKMRWTAQEYIDTHAPWAANPAVQVVVAGGAVNGMEFTELGNFLDHFKRLGVVITDDMTIDEALAAVEYWQDHPPEPEPTAEERIAAMMEFNAMASLDDE